MISDVEIVYCRILQTFQTEIKFLFVSNYVYCAIHTVKYIVSKSYLFHTFNAQIFILFYLFLV